MSDRLEEIAADEIEIGKFAFASVEVMKIIKRDHERIGAALQYIARILDGHENNQQLAYLRRIQNILAGTDDGLPANGKEPSDGT